MVKVLVNTQPSLRSPSTDFDLDSMGSIGVMCPWLRRISNSELVLIFHRRIDIAGSADRHHT